ncbi:MAG: hypothetical protein LBU32_05950 [Clostridiales bacterium]|nr:hypothetical protein [Clostridiales bacterium]
MPPLQVWQDVSPASRGLLHYPGHFRLDQSLRGQEAAESPQDINESLTAVKLA